MRRDCVSATAALRQSSVAISRPRLLTTATTNLRARRFSKTPALTFYRHVSLLAALTVARLGGELRVKHAPEHGWNRDAALARARFGAVVCARRERHLHARGRLAWEEWRATATFRHVGVSLLAALLTVASLSGEHGVGRHGGARRERSRRADARGRRRARTSLARA